MDGITSLMSCPNFDVVRLRPTEGTSVTLRQDHPFVCVSVVEGAGAVETPAGRHELEKGAHFVAPARSGDLTFTGDMTIIASWVPKEA